jgi:hypothetical protein
LTEPKSLADEVNQQSQLERQAQALEQISKTLTAMYGTLVKIEANTKPSPFAGTGSSYKR